MDEASYSFNWEANINEQPYYVLSAVCFPSEHLISIYQEIRKEFSNINLEGITKSIGKGFEIKARDIAKGSGYWKNHPKEKDEVLRIMLTAPKKYDGTAFVVIIDKLDHRKKYESPADPYLLSLEFIFERLQMYLSDIDDL